MSICQLVNFTHHFNSHAHVERDLNQLKKGGYYKISTHTLTWSVTIGKFLHTHGGTFQLTRSRGA